MNYKGFKIEKNVTTFIIFEWDDYYKEWVKKALHLTSEDVAKKVIDNFLRFK